MQESTVVSIIDDDESVRKATMKLLGLHGFAVYTFASAEEFLQSARAKDTRCLIVDIQMSGMDGLVLQEHLRIQGDDTPMIFITAFPDERNRTRALRAGAAGFLSKPFDGRTLLNCIDKALQARDDGATDG